MMIRSGEIFEGSTPHGGVKVLVFFRTRLDQPCTEPAAVMVEAVELNDHGEEVYHGRMTKELYDEFLSLVFREGGSNGSG